MCEINRKKYKLWDDSLINKPIEAVKRRISVNRVMEEYNVPKTTLKDRLAERVKHGSKSGPDPYLMSSEENKLVSF